MENVGQTGKPVATNLYIAISEYQQFAASLKIKWLSIMIQYAPGAVPSGL
jgi:hypothetical protein